VKVRAYLAVLLGFMLTAGSCTTVRANYFLLTDLTNTEKAELVFNKTRDQFQRELIRNRNYANAKKILTAFNDVLVLDPSHPQAEKFIAETEKIIGDTMERYLAGAEKLAALPERTAPQDYELLRTIRLAGTLDDANLRIIELEAEFLELKRLAIETRLERLRLLQPELMAENSPPEFQKKLKTADAVIDQILDIEPRQREAVRVQRDLSVKAGEFAAQDIEMAEKSLDAKKFAEAEAAILRAEKAISSLSKEPNPRIQELKYRVYFQWAQLNYDQKKYQSAGDRTNQALAVKRSAEALALKTRINQAAGVRDYDAEIGDILASIDGLLARQNVAAALNAIEANLARMKNAANRKALAERRQTAGELLAKIYRDGIALYNEEDYEGAASKFKLVAAADAGYEQADAYLDKANAKVRALSGGE